MKVAVVTGLFAVAAAIVGAVVASALTNGDNRETGTGAASAIGNEPQVSAGPSSPDFATVTPQTTTPSRASAPKAVYLADLPIIDARLGGTAPLGPATLAGKNYPRSVVMYPYNVNSRDWASFDLGAHYSRLSATVGIDSTSAEGHNLSWEIFADGRSARRGIVGLYKSTHVEIDVRGVQRLKVTAALLQDFNSIGFVNDLVLAYGDAILQEDPSNPPLPGPSS